MLVMESASIGTIHYVEICVDCCTVISRAELIRVPAGQALKLL